MILLLIITLLQLALFVFLAVFALYFASALFVWPPSFPSNKQSQRLITDFVRAKCSSGSGFKIVDLGSGYGHLVLALAKAFPHAQVTGVELLRFPAWCSKQLLRKYKNVSIVQQDLYAHDLSGYDAAVFFLRKDHQIDEKVLKEIKPGAIVVAHHFPLKNYQAQQVKEMKDLFTMRKIYFYQF